MGNSLAFFWALMEVPDALESDHTHAWINVSNSSATTRQPKNGL